MVSLRFRALQTEERDERLVITKEAVRKRIARGTLRADKDPDGTVRVYVPPSPTASDAPRRDELVEELRDRVRYLERQVEEERNARYRADELLARLMERVPELEPPAPPESPEPREEPGPYRVRPERAEPVEPVDPTREEPERVQPQRVDPERVEPRESPVSAADEQQGRGPSPMLEALRRPESSRLQRRSRRRGHRTAESARGGSKS